MEKDQRDEDFAWQPAVVRSMIDLLKSPHPEVQEASADALRNLAKNDFNKPIIAEYGGIEPLIKMLSSESSDAQEKAAWTLYTLAYNYEPNQKKIAQLGGIPPLIELLKSFNSHVQEASGLALCTLAKNVINQVIIAQEKGIIPLIQLLKSTNIEVQQEVAWTLNLLAENYQSKAFIIRGGGIQVLIDLLSSNNHLVQLQAVLVLKALGIEKKVVSTDEYSEKPKIMNNLGVTNLEPPKKVLETTELRSEADENLLLVKCFFEDDIRILLVSPEITVNKLKEKILKEYNRNDLIIKFKDSDGDLVTISSQRVLKYALSQDTNGGAIKMYLYNKNATSTGYSSSDERPNTPEINSRNSLQPIQANPDWIIPREELIFKAFLGKGYYGEVRLGEWRGSEVACKVIKRDDVKSDKWDLLQKEVEILSKLRHPKVILFLGVCLDSDYKYIVCEYMKKGCLYDIIHDSANREKYLDLKTKVKVAIDIAQGMNYLHGYPILHRDLHSKNILLDDQMNAKVADFGLSKIKKEEKYISNTHGAAAWMAPEVIKGAKCTEKADVYSYGVVLWELITAKDPCPKGLTIVQWASQVATGIRPDFTEQDCPPMWRRLIESCWSQDPQQRPDFREILNILKQEQTKQKIQHDPANMVTSLNNSHLVPENNQEQTDFSSLNLAPGYTPGSSNSGHSGHSSNSSQYEGVLPENLDDEDTNGTV